MTKEMYEDLFAKLQILELNTLTKEEEQDKHIVELEKEVAKLKARCRSLADKLRHYVKKTVRLDKLEQENAELKKNYEDSLVVCGILKEKIDLMTKPSPFEAMQDVLITAQKEANKKQNDQLTKAKELLNFWLDYFGDGFNRRIKYEEVHKARVETEQFLREADK